MFVVDLAATAESRTEKFFSDLSFSFLTWRTIERIEAGEVAVQDLDDETVMQLIFTILPGGDTLFHRLMTLGEVDTLEYVANKCLKSEQGEATSLIYSFPYLRNQQGLCPVGQALGTNQHKYTNLLLKYLSWQGLDHHSRYISQYLPELLQLELGHFATYVDSRSVPTSVLDPYGGLGSIKRCINDENRTPGILATDFWADSTIIEEALFKDSIRH